MDLDKDTVQKQKDLHEAFKYLQEGYLLQKENEKYTTTRVLIPLVVACIAATGVVCALLFKLFTN